MICSRYTTRRCRSVVHVQLVFAYAQYSTYVLAIIRSTAAAAIIDRASGGHWKMMTARLKKPFASSSSS